MLRFDVQHTAVAVSFVSYHMCNFYRCQKLGLQHVKIITEIISLLSHTGRTWTGIVNVFNIFFSKDVVIQI